MSARKGPSIRLLLLGAHAFVWLLPLIAFSLLHVYDVYLLRQTEHQLIAESVVVGEAYRDAYLRTLGRDHDDYRPARPAAPRASYDVRREGDAERYLPIEAQIDFEHEVLSRELPTFSPKTQGDVPATCRTSPIKSATS